MQQLLDRTGSAHKYVQLEVCNQSECHIQLQIKSKLLFTAKTLMEPDRIGSGKCYHREILLRVVARLVGY